MTQQEMIGMSRENLLAFKKGLEIARSYVTDSVEQLDMELDWVDRALGWKMTHESHEFADHAFDKN